MVNNVVKKLITKKALIALAGVAVVGGGAAAGIHLAGNLSEDGMLEETGLTFLSAKWPEVFDVEGYVEPEFVDVPNRTNNAFNVSDFGEQGKNGWFYRYGSAQNPSRSQRLENFDGEKYSQRGVSGLEVKNNFIHTSEAAAPILEWRAAKDGKVNVSLTYVKSVNGDKNPSYPDGVTVYAYKGDEMLGRYDVDVSTETEKVLEQELKELDVKELESLYFVVDAKANNAYDGGSLYVSINDVDNKGLQATVDHERKNNNANNFEDFGAEGHRGWTYLHGKSVKDASLVSTFNGKEYLNATSPNLTMSEGFIHPSINDNAILCWQPAVDGDIELRMKYSKFEQNDGNPKYPDGVTVSVYKNGENLYTKKVAAPSSGTNEIKFRDKDIKVTTADKLYFMVSADGNASYDGGAFDINILDRKGISTEKDVAIDETETRQNFADVKYDFGEQGNNGWFFQEGYEDDPTDTLNMTNFEKDEERYFDESYLEIKRDFVNTGKGRSAVIKWKVAQTGKVKIDASYTKFKNEDKNPSWPDGTKVTIFHNDTPLVSEEFAPDRINEVTKRLDVAEVDVAKDDFITMVVNPKENNAYDAGKFEFSIKGITPLTGKTEKDVVSYSDSRSNNCSTVEDFGSQGANGLCYQSGYYLDPGYAVNLETYAKNEKYTTKDGVEIKRDYIMPGNKGRSAIVKWVAKEEGSVDVLTTYTKHKNLDKNPEWPDGVNVFLMKNGQVLKKEEFAPEVSKEVTKDLSYEGLWVKAGDCISLMVDGKENTAYDGGNYTFVVEDADYKTTKMVNNSGSNYANLKVDFGEQGNNGWYYLEGRSIKKAEILTKKTDDGSGYVSRKAKWLEVKRDYVQPRLNAHAMYKWVVAVDGNIDINGSYAKHGNEDPNMDWPDGVVVSVYKNDSELLKEVVTCPRGENNRTVKNIQFNKLAVKAGDILTFDIGCNKNSAWDGGCLDIDIADSEMLRVTVGDEERSNNTSLGALTTPLAQGQDGWWFLEGKSIDSARCLMKTNDDSSAFLSSKNEGLEMKKDYVHPAKDAAAIYQWVVYEDGKIDVLGNYVKYGQNDGNPSWPDGVKVLVYVNDTVLVTEDVEVFQGDGNDNSVNFMLEGLNVSRGDKISFVIDAKDNNAWDAGRLSVNIYDASDIPEEEARENNTTLADDFTGIQGENGWYYGMCDWDGKNFERLPFDEENNRYYNNGKPELKPDFVEPGNGRNAAYMWMAAKNGRIVVDGSYTKFANSADPNANGVCMRIFINGEEKKWIGGDIQGNFGEERTVSFKEIYTVHKGDSVMFAIDPDGNDSYDGGRLEVKIYDADIPEESEENTSEENEPGTPDSDDSDKKSEDESEEESEGESESESEEESGEKTDDSINENSEDKPEEEL
ncbi:hypothetical protein [Pseudobutyrivibrio xylanivorans]|uniref:Uncharacterized protein n=1 Tax=Pseudobutyrivibrio xylanivorans DSM 14809 TaxID=1123012 RepID=A0A1M6FR91_PSEXY|nr:hypothetical protein [Pseudobutyrivibrio xylanivorans]SHJ00217.1 hypothetical protein SAMN02745725_01535 [Pseudobutyrivibrio xylanivorans DSM 14809]